MTTQSQPEPVAVTAWEELIRERASAEADRENACSGCCGSYGEDTWLDYEASVRADFEEIGAAYVRLHRQQSLAEAQAEVDRAKDDEFDRGYLVAVANLQTLFDEPDIARHVLAQLDIDAKRAGSLGLAEADMKAIAPLFGEIKRRARNARAAHQETPRHD